MILTIIGWALFGLIVGVIARLLYPGPQPIGIVGTMLLGVVGSLLGGGIAWLIFGGEYGAASWIMSIVGAFLLVWLGESFGGGVTAKRSLRR